MNYGRKFKLLIFFLGIVFFLHVSKIFAVSCGDPCSDVNSCGQVVDACNSQITALQGQANTLSNQITQFNYQIRLGEVKIQQTEDQINLLGGRINEVQSSLTDLNKAFNARVVETYKISRLESPIYFLLSGNLEKAVNEFHYLQQAEDSDRNLLTRLQTAQTSYQNSKADSEKLQKQLQEQQDNLNAQKVAKANLLISTQNNETKYQQLLAQAQAQLSAFRNFVANQGGASILSNQTFCDGWGCYYNQRDSQWGNRGLGNSSLSVAGYGCLVSSSAMVASFYKKNLTPGDIAGSTSAFFSPDSGTALLWRDITVNNVRIIRNSVGAYTSNIDSELAAGRPVIVGLYNGPAHFIVLKSGSNGNYIMNDPFMPNGHDVSFTSKYSVSNITDVETVSVQ